MQSYVEGPPVPALRGLVRAVWIQQTGPVPYVQRNLPTGGAELHCVVGDTPRWVGPLTSAATQTLAPGTTLIGVRFHPGAASPVLGLPLTELLDVVLDAGDLWGPAASRIGEHLYDASSPATALALLQEHLADRLARTAGPDPLVAAAVRELQPFRATEVRTLTSNLAISESQLRRRCQAATGLGPKALHRTLRFQGFLALTQEAKAEGRMTSLAELALEAGYSDQAHLSRECLRLTGLSPGSFLGEAGKKCDCGHDHSWSYKPILSARPQPTKGATATSSR